MMCGELSIISASKTFDLAMGQEKGTLKTLLVRGKLVTNMWSLRFHFLTHCHLICCFMLPQKTLRTLQDNAGTSQGTRADPLQGSTSDITITEQSHVV